MCKFVMGLLKTLDDKIWKGSSNYTTSSLLQGKIILINIYIFNSLGGRVTNFVFNSSLNVQIRWINTEESDLQCKDGIVQQLMDFSTERWKYLGYCDESIVWDDWNKFRFQSWILNLDSVSHCRTNCGCLYFVVKCFIRKKFLKREDLLNNYGVYSFKGFFLNVMCDQITTIDI